MHKNLYDPAENDEGGGGVVDNTPTDTQPVASSEIKAGSNPVQLELPDVVPNLDDMGDEDFTKPAKKDITQPTNDTKAAANVKVTAKNVKATTTTTEPVAPTNQQVDPSKRDYSVFDPVMAELLKKQPNVIYNWAKENKDVLNGYKKSIEEEVKKSANVLPPSYVEHPDAWILSPQYKQYTDSYKQACSEEQHWIKQLAAVRKGEPWKDVAGGEEMEASNEAEAAIMGALNQAQQYRQHFRAQVEGLKTSHQSSYQKDVQSIQGECKKYFPWITDEKMLDLDVEKEDGKSVGKMREVLAHATNLVPQHLRGHPMSQIFPNMYVANLMLNQNLRAAQREIERLKHIEKDTNVAQPLGDKTKAGAVKQAKSLKGKPLSFQEVPDVGDLFED